MLSAPTFGHLRNIPVPQMTQINTDLLVDNPRNLRNPRETPIREIPHTLCAHPCKSVKSVGNRQRERTSDSGSEALSEQKRRTKVSTSEGKML